MRPTLTYKKFFLIICMFLSTVLAYASKQDLSETADGHIRLARAYFAKDNIDRAIRELRLAQTIAPDNPEPYLMLGTIYNSVNKPDDAVLQFSKAP